MNIPTKANDFNGLVTEALKTTSRIIAEKFGKQHGHVMRDIRALVDANPEWGVSNFGETPYVDPQNGQTYQMYEMTRDGYSMLVMGFTGKRAMEWKIKFLDAFNAMEELLRKQAQNVIAFDPEDPVQLRGLLVNYAERTQIAEARVIALEPKAEAYDRLDGAEGSVTPRVAAKTLGVPERKFTKWLEVNGWAFRQNGKGKLQAYSERRKQSYLEHRLRTFTDSNGDERSESQMLVTPRGMARLAQIFTKEGFAA